MERVPRRRRIVRRKLDKRIALALLLVLLAGTTGAQELEKASYEAWNGTSEAGKVAFVQGMMVGAYWVAVAYMSENPGRELPRIDHLVPKGIDGGSLSRLVTDVYREPKNRGVPVVYIVVNWQKYWALYGGGL
jgi:hypothetical protein